MPWVSLTMPVTLLAAENEPMRPFGIRQQLLLELGGVDVPVGVLGDHHDIGDRLAPGQLVGMVLEGPDEHDGTFLGGDGVADVIAVVQARGKPDPEDADQLVDGSRAS